MIKSIIPSAQMPALKFSGTMHAGICMAAASLYIGTTKEISADMDTHQSAWTAAVVLRETAI